MIQLNKVKSKVFTEKTKNKINAKNKIKKLKAMIREYENTLNFEYMECPDCKTDKLIRYGTYKRNIVIEDETVEINIKRVQCKNCGHTHAIIPTFIKPYFVYESSFIDFVVLVLTEQRKKKIKEIIEKINITRQIVRQWIKRYMIHKTRLETMYEVHKVEEIIDIIFNQEYIKDYRYAYKIHYFENLPT